MTYRRGNQSVEVELSRLQQAAENWSDDLDGEEGVIRQFREDRAERKGTVKSLKLLALVLGIITGLQAVFTILRAARVIQ